MFDGSKFQILYFPNYNLDDLIAFSKELSEKMFFKVFENLKKNSQEMKQGCYSQRRHVLLIDLRDTRIYILFMHKRPQFPQFFSVFSRTVCPILVICSVRRDKKG